MTRHPAEGATKPTSSPEEAAALAAFLAWPAPAAVPSRGRERQRGHPKASGLRPGSLLASVTLTVAIGLVLGVLEFAAPLVGVGSHPWTLGAHLLLLCHLG